MLQLVKTKEYLLLIDEVAEIKENYFLLDNEYIYKGGADMANESAKKIVSYYPLTKEAKELDLPLLPPFEEDNIEKLADNYAVDTQKVHPADSFIAKQSYIEGYKAAQSKQFSLEDMIGFVKYYILKQVIPYELDVISGKITDEQKIQMLQSDIDYNWNKLAQEYIQSLSTQQLPKEFVPDTMVIDNKIILHVEINSEGKEEIIGTYKY